MEISMLPCRLMKKKYATDEKSRNQTSNIMLSKHLSRVKSILNNIMQHDELVHYFN